MSKKTIITVLGVAVSVMAFLPIPYVLKTPIFFLLGILIIFFTRFRFKVVPTKYPDITKDLIGK